MSMPASLEVAVVAATAERLAAVADHPAISAEGIVPRYRLVALDCARAPDVRAFADVATRRFGYWIALDDDAFRACRAVPRYSRGFYDHWLPDPVVRVDGRAQFDAVVERVWDAFCSTS